MANKQARDLVRTGTDAHAPTRRRLLALLVRARGRSWHHAPVIAPLRGSTRLETRRKSYRFEDGVCVEVTRRDGVDDGPDPLLGMRVAGFIDGESDPAAGAPALSASWRPGTSAVLFRPEGKETIAALTSPSFAFFDAGNLPGAQPDVRELPTSRFHAKDLARAAPPEVAPLPTQSMTRMFF